ncbi:zinc-ribbon-domain-containing protein [Dunaliella salina]|uniref:Zinc-ribbon-domain-containing protein n=1 Tax=Dunaliella salina TaxID=3046 RepID=A0ABQ7H2X1_DUNSA|nr:zinc-ribbon-domain-containing protein [Dunaliella salina]|eukprot:KAF5841208.1 zinc-ribbon-domain-containing protein [Dunaliella salina]
MHTLDRKAVKELICALCETRQPAGRTCISCGVAFGQYTCLDCNFFDDDVSKRQFHCNACGICRVGGRDNYFHCSTCNCCYAIQLQNTHVCIENSMHNNCPVCFEYIFDSVNPICVLPCGHTIHQDCLHKLQQHAMYVCPSCNKNYLSEASMERVWESMDAAVASTPMPPEYRDMQVDILCNNCLARSRVNFHVVGHKCQRCGGYNTQRI